MKLEALEVFSFPVPFKLVFRHASARRASAENVIVAVRSSDGAIGYGEGCPRDYVTGETIGSAAQFIAEHRNSIAAEVASLDGLRGWINRNCEAIDANSAAFCAMELALLDLFGKTQSQPLEALLDLPSLDASFRYSAVLGDNNRLLFWLQFRRYWRAGFRDFKLKVSGDIGRDRAKIAHFRNRQNQAVRLRLDANNLWRTVADCTSFLAKLGFPFFAIEEPLTAGDIGGLRTVAQDCGVRIILDESLLRAAQLDALQDANHWIVNLRISKMGGLLRSLVFAEKAAGRGIGVIVGAHVGETSILTRAALTLAQALGDGIVAMEGAYGTHLLQRDLTTPCLMFGEGGELCPAATLDGRASGLGLSVHEHDLVANPIYSRRV